MGSLAADKGSLPLKAMDVRASVSGLISEAAVRQTFYNEADDCLEATYIFPLPARAVVTHFRMMVAGRVVEAQLKDRSTAQQEYQAAIVKGHRSALAEQQQPGVFSLRVTERIIGSMVSGHKSLRASDVFQESYSGSAKH